MAKIKYKDVIKTTHHDIFNGVTFDTKADLLKALKKEMDIYIKCMKDVENEFLKYETPAKHTIDYVNDQNKLLDQQIFVLDAIIHTVKKHEIKLPMQIIPNRKLLNQITAAIIDRWK